MDSTGHKHPDSEQPVAKLLRTYLEPLLHVSEQFFSPNPTECAHNGMAYHSLMYYNGGELANPTYYTLCA